MAKTHQYYRNIYILEDSVKFRIDVQKVLNLIGTTHAGHTLFKHIALRARHLVIAPYVPSQEPVLGPVNAYAEPDNLQDSYTANAPVMAWVDIPGKGPIPFPTGKFGTGKGTGVTLKFDPALYRQLARNRGSIYPGDGPGEVLYHEMIHALRMIHGKDLRTIVTEDLHMDDFEEFCAILAANIYRSERGFHRLLMDHRSTAEMPKNLTRSEAYASFFWDEIEKWFDSQRDFCLDLASSPARFNPMKFVAAGLDLPVVTPMALGPRHGV
jgi:hypothetical protein